MKVNTFLLFGIFLIGISPTKAQEKKNLTLDDAIHLAWKNSNEVNLANAKVSTRKYELKATKNNQYPDLKVSGQYQRLTKADIDLKLNKSTTPQKDPVVDQLVLGQINATLPVFAGFKIRNSIKASENLYESERAAAEQTKEEIAMKVVNHYADLYKAQKTLELLKENQKRAQQRATDFSDLEKNGIIPRNDLMKAQLQVSKIQLSIDEAEKNLNIVNFYLVTLLKLPAATKLAVNENDFANFQMNNLPVNEEPAIMYRKDLEAMRLLAKASQVNVEIAKSGYYPSVAIIGGYTALDLKNVITVQNAMNFGVGISYDLSAIIKNATTVKIAESKLMETQNSQAMLTDYIKLEVQNAIEDYSLALKQNDVYAQAVEQSSENYRIIKDKYDNGLSDTNDLLEADVEQLGTKINKALAKANIIQKYYELLSVTGQLSQSFNQSKI